MIMKNIIKSKGFLGLLVTVILLTVFSINYAVGVDGPQVKNLNLQEAIDLAIENNPDYQIAKLSVDKAQSDLDAANSIIRASMYKTDNINSYQSALVKFYNPKAAEVNLIITQKSFEVAEKQLKLGVENGYYNVLKAQKNLEIKRENLKYMQEQLKIAQAAYKIGTKAKLDVSTVEAGVAAAQADVASAENTYNTAVMELDRTLGLDIDTPLKLTSAFSIEKIGKTINVQDSINKALEDNIDILTVKKNLELSQLKYDITKKWYPSGTNQHDSAKIDEQMAAAKTKKQELATTSLVKQNYMTLLSLEKVIDWNSKQVEQAQENARIYMVKYEAGLATSLDAEKAAIDLKQAKENLAESIYQYNTLKSQFKFEIFKALN